MKLSKVLVDKRLIFLQYLYWYLLYSFSLTGLVLVFFFSYTVLSIVVLLFLLIIAVLLLTRFQNVENHIIEFDGDKAKLLINDRVSREIEGIRQVVFIISGYQDEPILLSFSHKSGRNKLVIKTKAGEKFHFLFMLKTQVETESLFRIQKRTNLPFKIIMRKQFLS